MLNNSLFWHKLESHRLQVRILIQHHTGDGIIHIVVEEELGTRRWRTNEVTFVLYNAAY